MAHQAARSARAAALLVSLVACGDNATGELPADAGGDASIDAPADAMRSVQCAREGVSSVSGSGPGGPLGGRHVYAQALAGFCHDQLVLVVTADDPLAWPYLDDSVVIRAVIPNGSLGGTAEWSGTFAADVSRPDETVVAGGLLQVDRATPGHANPTLLRATARVDDGAWHFTATLDAPYCTYVVCF